MNNDKQSVILFYSTSYAIWTSKVLKKNSIKHKMIPVPRHLSSDCGYCVRINSIDSDVVVSIIKDTGIEYDRVEEI